MALDLLLAYHLYVRMVSVPEICPYLYRGYQVADMKEGYQFSDVEIIGSESAKYDCLAEIQVTAWKIVLRIL